MDTNKLTEKQKQELNKELVDLSLESWEETFRQAQKYANKKQAIINRYSEILANKKYKEKTERILKENEKNQPKKKK